MLDADSTALIADGSVVLAQTGLLGATDARGRFAVFQVPAGDYTLLLSPSGYLPGEISVKVSGDAEQFLTLEMQRDPKSIQTSATDIPTILPEEAKEGEGTGEIANLLHSAQDVFQTAANFGWSTFRFRERSYDSEHCPLYLNGFNINDPESGITFFGELGGLSDVLRAR